MRTKANCEIIRWTNSLENHKDTVTIRIPAAQVLEVIQPRTQPLLSSLTTHGLWMLKSLKERWRTAERARVTARSKHKPTAALTKLCRDAELEYLRTLDLYVDWDT